MADNAPKTLDDLFRLSTLIEGQEACDVYFIIHPGRNNRVSIDVMDEETSDEVDGFCYWTYDDAYEFLMERWFGG